MAPAALVSGSSHEAGWLPVAWSTSSASDINLGVFTPFSFIRPAVTPPAMRRPRRALGAQLARRACRRDTTLVNPRGRVAGAGGGGAEGLKAAAQRDCATDPRW